MSNNKTIYGVRRSVNPTRRANAERTRVSSGPVPPYEYYKYKGYINFSVLRFWRLKNEL